MGFRWSMIPKSGERFSGIPIELDQDGAFVPRHRA
jgi:hypothetical protein